MLNEARLRMATRPRATLIDNPVSTAPGFQIGNVFVMAGIPIGHAGHVLMAVKGGWRVARPCCRTPSAPSLPEGTIAKGLGELQQRYMRPGHRQLSLPSPGQVRRQLRAARHRAVPYRRMPPPNCARSSRSLAPLASGRAPRSASGLISRNKWFTLVAIEPLAFTRRRRAARSSR